MGIGDGHDLSSPRFSGDPILEACYDNEQIMKIPAAGPAVTKIQQALVDLHYDLPMFGVDGGFGNETAAAVSRFQRDQGISSDGVIGPTTMAALDREISSQPSTPVVTGQLGPGDHVWYYDHQISTGLDIPRQAWFDGSDPAVPTDYQGHGDEIFNFVIHANGEIRRGRPHMRNREGTHAWLNNNPGNLTGKAGGPDYGQYRDKFNWHNFLIFPTFEAGFAAIAARLLRPDFRDLSILDAFRKYAPASDGNDPDAYASAVASAAGLSTSTLVRDLTDEQMRLMQEKIAQIEGSVPGVVLGPDSQELPEEIRSRL
jgi:hypothetical protein